MQWLEAQLSSVSHAIPVGSGPPSGNSTPERRQSSQVPSKLRGFAYTSEVTHPESGSKRGFGSYERSPQDRSLHAVLQVSGAGWGPGKQVSLLFMRYTQADVHATAVSPSVRSTFCAFDEQPVSEGASTQNTVRTSRLCLFIGTPLLMHQNHGSEGEPRAPRLTLAR